MSAPAAASATAPAGRTSRWLAVRHETHYDYDAAVEVAHHVAHLRPRQTEVQAVHGWQLDVEPGPDTGLVSGQDCWGNWRHNFSHATVHERLTVTSFFRAELAAPLAAGIPPGTPPWEDIAERLSYRGGAPMPPAVEFSLASPYAPRAPELAALARGAFRPGRPIAEGAWALMEAVHAHMAFKPASTTVATPALQALAQRAGVCQDFAHIMIGALRSVGLAARYVSGYLLTHPAPGQPRLVGADASHAWVAVWTGQGWWALDPTNAVAAGLDHVTVAWGRDYGDVAPLRGVIRGGGSAAPHVAVTVEPVDGPA